MKAALWTVGLLFAGWGAWVASSAWACDGDKTSGCSGKHGASLTASNDGTKAITVADTKSGCAKSCGAKGTALTKLDCPSAQSADALIQEWTGVSARLAAMNEGDKQAREAAMKKMNEAHPAAAQFSPSFQFVCEAVSTATKLDTVTCEKMGAAKTAAAGDQPAFTLTEEQKTRMAKRMALTAKAHELLCTATGSMGGCSAEKSACGTEAKLTSADEKSQGCPHAKQAAALAKADGKPEKKKAALTSAEGQAGGYASEKGAVTAASESICPKATTAKGEELIAKSGMLLAEWQNAEIRLASMTDADRSAAEQACVAGAASCPAGALMPKTLATVAELLTEAAKLDAVCQAECSKNPEMIKNVPADLIQLQKTRMLVSNAALNVLQHVNTLVKPAKQVASAK